MSAKGNRVHIVKIIVPFVVEKSIISPCTFNKKAAKS